jgi:outer membrane protein assembly factor BamB
MRFSKLFALAFVVLGVITLPGCWSQFRGNAAHTGYNPYEHTLGPEDVGAGLLPAWTGAKDAAGNPMGPISSSPAVAAVLNGSASGEYVFIGSEDGYLYAFNALGCGGNLMCGPVWQSSNLGNITNSSPAVAVEVINGVQESVVYITSGFGINGTGGGIFALNAATGAQIWKTGDFTSQFSSPNVVDGVVYVLAGDHYVDAIDATMGTVLWQGPVANNYPSPAVANGEVYVGERFTLKAFDANGCNNPVCSPLWTGQAGGTYLNESPAVANAVVNGNQNPVVYVGSYNGYLYAFDANGIINCTNNVCQPLWVGAGAGEVSSPAVAPQREPPRMGWST